LIFGKDYPNYELQLTKEFNNGKIKLIISDKQNFEDKQIILNYLDVKPDEANFIFNIAI
jgi:hypothetical protein